MLAVGVGGWCVGISFGVGISVDVGISVGVGGKKLEFVVRALREYNLASLATAQRSLRPAR